MSTFSQPSPLDYVPQQPQEPPAAGTGTLASLMASYALTLEESARDGVRSALPVDDRPAFDMALLVQRVRGEGEAEHRRSELLRMELEKLEIRDAAKVKHAEAKHAALTDEAAYEAAASSFAADVLGSDSLGDIEIPPALVENYLDRNSMARLYGPSGSKKSFAVLDLAACVASGIEWHGNATHRAKTLYIVAEGATGILKRVRAWESLNGMKMETRFYPKAVQIADEDSMRQLVAFSKLGGYEFIVFDTQARCTVGIDENDNTRMGEIVAALDILKQKTGACVLLVHHSGTEGGRGRGATAVLGAMDAEFEVVCKQRGLFVDVLTKKRKDGREMGALSIEMEERFVTTPRGSESSLGAKPGLSSADPFAAAAAPRVTELQAFALETLAKHDTASNSIIREGMGIEYAERGKVSEYMKALLDKDCVEKVGTGQWRISEAGKRVLNVRGLISQGHQEELGEDD